MTARIGLVGELLVGEWIHRTYKLLPEVTWVSGNRRIRFTDDKANDSLGYAFLVVLDDVRLLVEVKATKDGTPQITLGESEVRRAQNVKQDERYLIAFTHALDPDLPGHAEGGDPAPVGRVVVVVGPPEHLPVGQGAAPDLAHGAIPRERVHTPGRCRS